MDDVEPLWKRIFLNELFLAGIAALVILYVAYRLATRSDKLEADAKPVRMTRP